MKKLYITIAFAALQLAAVAQTVNVHFKNGQTIVFPSGNVEFVDFSEKAPDPTVTAGAVVDLGLSVYWCSCNVGAEAPEEYGDYFAWGETKAKSSYTKANYSYYDSNTNVFTDIGDNICGTEYDAATVNLGSDWRMPTKTEIQELLTQCTWEWTQINGINGYVVTGPNNNSIFLPAAGCVLSSPSGVGSNTMYSTSNIGHDNTESTIIISYSSNKPNLYNLWEKYEGTVIRPVTSNPNAGGGPVDHSNDYLVTEKIFASFTGGSISKVNGVIQAGSVLNVKFTNASDESITLIGAEIHEKGGNPGNNVLDTEEEIAAGSSKSFGIRLGKNMTTPVVCFTYRYNRKKYTVEATYTSN